MTLQIKRLKQEDIGFLKQLFDRTPILSEYNPFNGNSDNEFLWQFFSNDFIESIYYIAYDDEAMILAGTLAAIIIPMRTPDGNICYSIKPEDALINVKMLVKYNMRDIFSEMFTKIMEETKLRNIQFSWGFTEAVDTFNRLGFQNCFASKQGVYTIKPLLAYKHLVKLNNSNLFKQKVQIMGLSICSKLKTFTFRSSFKNIYCKETDFELIDEKILLSFLPENLYSIYLSKQFLQGRVVKNPSELKYGILQFENQLSQIIAYLIFSEKKDNVFFIEQFLFDKSLKYIEKQRVVYHALTHLKHKGATIIRAMGFNHNPKNEEEIEILGRVGFIFAKRGIPFILKSNEIIKSNNIYLSRLNTQGTF